MSSITLENSEYTLHDPQLYLDPIRHKIFCELREHSPVSWHPLSDDDGYWAVVKHKDIVAISSDAETYSSAQGAFLRDDDPVIGAMITTDPPRHNAMRRSVVDFFNHKALRPLEDWLREECKNNIEQALVAGDVEFVFDVAAALPLSVIGKLMQLPDADRAEMLRLTDSFVAASRESVEALQAASGEMAGFALGHAELRRGKAGQDLISSMLSVDGQELTEPEFATMFIQIAVAATETTRTALTQIVIELARDPSLIARLANAECDLDTAINEFLRYHPPVNHARRTATRDHEFAGQSIRAGDKLVLLYPSGNFDEDVFDQPDSFDIARKPNPHLTFGVGQHVCLGFRLARMELKIFMEEFLKKVGSVELLAEPITVVQFEAKAVQEAKMRIKGL